MLVSRAGPVLLISGVVISVVTVIVGVANLKLQIGNSKMVVVSVMLFADRSARVMVAVLLGSLCSGVALSRVVTVARPGGKRQGIDIACLSSANDSCLPALGAGPVYARRSASKLSIRLIRSLTWSVLRTSIV
jgi:hypothetical protein